MSTECSFHGNPFNLLGIEQIAMFSGIFECVVPGAYGSHRLEDKLELGDFG